jgi:F-type H+-transporting ATPase subunit a
VSRLAVLTFPPIGELVDWRRFGPFGFNKTALVDMLAVVGTLSVFFLAARKKRLVPTGIQNLAESIVEFITDQIVLQTIGPDGTPFLPFLTALFCFVLIGNVFEIIPIIQFPANARMANPVILAIIVFVLYNYIGFRRQGLRYLKNIVPAGVPKPFVPIVAFNEFLQVLIMRPFSLAVRLFGNMLAGHLLLVTFALLTDALLFHNTIIFLKPVAVLPAAVDVVITGFELLVAVLQAFIFTILTAVYIGAAMHPEH